MNKPTILHIGGTHSVHVTDLVGLLHQHGYKQCVLSYRKENRLRNKIPVYVFPYSNINENNYEKYAPKMRTLIKQLLQKEKIDLIHSHFIFSSCYATNMCSRLSKTPLIVTPWAIRLLFATGGKKEALQKCFTRSASIMLNSRHFFNAIKKRYTNVEGKFFHCRLPLDLSIHHDKLWPAFDNYRILAGRITEDRYKQDLLLYAIKDLSKLYDIKVTFIVGQYAPQGKKYMHVLQQLAKKLQITKLCTFIDRSLKQKEFSELIRKHNLAYSIAPDCGLAQTTIQTAYAGLITMVRNNPFINGVLDDKINVLRVGEKVRDFTNTGIIKKDVFNTLSYAIEHKNELQEKMFRNNRKLRNQSVEYTLPKIMELYRRLS